MYFSPASFNSSYHRLCCSSLGVLLTCEHVYCLSVAVILKLVSWASLNGFVFRTSKDHLCVFLLKMWSESRSFWWLNASVIHTVSGMKFWCPFFDCALIFCVHIQHLKMQCSQALKVLYSKSWGQISSFCIIFITCLFVPNFTIGVWFTVWPGRPFFITRASSSSGASPKHWCVS